MRLDARIPVRLLTGTLPAGNPDGALLLDAAAAPAARPDGWMLVRRMPADAPPPAFHLAGCVCCAGRTPLAILLSALFRQRATGQVGLFRSVTLLLLPAAAPAAAAVLLDDPLVLGRYRLTLY